MLNAAMMFARVLAAAIVLIAMLALSACAGPAHFATVLDAPDGLRPGDPVLHAGTTIGSVTGVTPLAGGGSEAQLTIDSGHTRSVRVDSVMILSNAGSGPALELENRDPSSAYAVEGATLYGASNPDQAELLEASLGSPTFVQRYANLFGQMTPPAASPVPGAPPSVLTQQLQQLTQQTLAAATALAQGSPTSAAQLDEYRHNAAVVERQLRAHGKDAAADQLAASVMRLNSAAPAGVPAGSAAPGAPPNTLTVPPAAPTTP